MTAKLKIHRSLLDRSSKLAKRKPKVSMRKIARETGMKRESVRQMLRKIQFMDTLWSAEASGTSVIVEHRQNPKSVMFWGGN
ncbi:hypothetical protein ACLKA6_001768 [Drosophila palustris]